MSFLSDLMNKLKGTSGDAAGKFDPNEIKNNVSDAAGNIIDQARNVTDKIPGEWDDKIVDQAEELKNKIDGQQ